MTGRIKVIQKQTEVVDGRKKQDISQFYECFCEIQSLGTNEKYKALQQELENTIVFKVRNCKKIEQIRLKLKEFYAEYKGVEFKIYDASPMHIDDRWVLLKCRASS